MLTEPGTTPTRPPQTALPLPPDTHTRMQVKQGNTVALMSPNHVDYFAAFHGAARLGANTTPLNPAYTMYEVERQVEASGAVLMIAHRDCMDVVKAALERMDRTDMPVVVLDDIPDASAPNAFEALRTSTHAPDESLFPEIHGDSLVSLPYSSGTTGLPKGTMLSHNNLIANIMQGTQLEVRKQSSFRGHFIL
jgi:acyl-CoA synthetase (AMP-forming)/AMP-acid ligase II